LPPTKTGGFLAVSVELKQGSHPMYVHQREKKLTFSGTFDGSAAAYQPVVGDGWYPAAWQTWRLKVPASDKSRPLEFRVIHDLPTDAECRVSAHFVPE
jgi:hypothetical protein